MNKDEEKAIEVLKRVLMANRFDGIFTSIDIIIEAIDIVLNLIKKQQAEIEFYKSIIKTEKNKYKNTKKSLKGQIEKKDKIINEMAELMERHGTGRYAFSCIFQKDKCSQNGCKQCIIDYFKRE